MLREVRDIQRLIRNEEFADRIRNPKTLIVGLIRLLLAKIYLISCVKGKWITAKGRPRIVNKGSIIIDDWVRIWSDVVKCQMYTKPNATIKIGRNSRINGVHMSASNSIQIGENVRIAPETVILDSDFHDVYDIFSKGKTAPVIINDNVWISMRCLILKGVTIGKGSVVAAGSVVTKSIPPNKLVAGVPARIVRDLD